MYLGYFAHPESSKILATEGSTAQGLFGFGLGRALKALVILEFKDGRFILHKERGGNPLSVAAEKYFGLHIDADGCFVNERDKLVFLLKYQGLTSDILLDLPLI